MSVPELSHDTEQPWDAIQQWRANTTEDSTEKQLLLGAKRYHLIIQLYKPLLKLLCLEKDHDINQRRLKRAFETLLLWGQQYEVSVGKLDELIDVSWRLRRSVLRTLTSIGRTLTDRLAPRIQQSLPERAQRATFMLQEAREEAIFLLTDDIESEYANKGYDDDSSDTSSLFEADSLSEIAEDLTSNVDNLMELDALYDAAKEHANIYEGEPVAKSIESAEPACSSAAKVFTEIIRMRFPKANHELLDYLGRANYHRLVKVSQKREMNEENADDSTEIGGHVAATVDGSRFHDSGIGTSVDKSSYAETVMSFHHGNSHVSRIPPLPEDGKKGLPFPCIACGKKVVIRSDRDWKRHLFLDLEPYNCLETSCRHNINPLERKDWADHLAAHHSDRGQWQSFQCGLCLKETGQGEANVTIHLEKHLQDIALTTLPKNMDDGPGPQWVVEHLMPPSQQMDPTFYLPDTALSLDRKLGPQRPQPFAPPAPKSLAVTHASKSYQCDLCSISFNHKKDLGRHTASVHTDRDKLFTCRCKYVSPRKDNFRRHLRLCDKTISLSHYTCRCGSYFLDKEMIENHVLSCLVGLPSRRRPHTTSL